MDWVLRAGIATAERLTKGYGAHAGAPGIYGFSVQYEPGLSVDELARARRFPHRQLSVAYDTGLAASLRPLGYSMRIIASPGRGYHHTLAVLYDASGQVLPALSPDAAGALAATFTVIPNLYRGNY